MLAEITNLLIPFMVTFIVVFILFITYIVINAKQMSSPAILRFEKEKYYKTEIGEERFPSLMDNDSIHLSVIVPSYNEEERLPIMMEEALLYLEEKAKSDPTYTYEVIIVDDGSSDKTSDVGNCFMEKYGSEKIRVLTLMKNRGKGGAVRLGMMSARGKYLLMVDADGATRFSDLCKLFTKLQDMEKSSEGRMMQPVISVGSRAHLEEDSIAERSFFRTILMKGFHMIVWLLCVRSVRDSQCGFKLLTRTAARLTFLNLHVERWAFDVELLYIAEHLRIPVVEVAVKWTEIEGSKIVPIFSWLQMGRDIFLIWLHYFLGLWKIKEVK